MGSNRKNNSPLAQQRFEVNPQMVQMQYPNPMEKRYKLYNVSTGLLLSTVHTFYPTEEGLRKHNSSELGIQRPQQRTVKFKAGSKSCSSSSQDSYITTRVGITIPPSHSNAEDNSPKVINKKGIRSNPMIQPEPEDLPKDNPKLEIAVLRPSDAMHNPSHSHSGSSNQKTCHHLSTEILTLSLTSHVEIVDIE
ncbi:hypothetical protein Tco_0267501 [Tanacetum coccineum]